MVIVGFKSEAIAELFIDCYALRTNDQTDWPEPFTICGSSCTRHPDWLIGPKSALLYHHGYSLGVDLESSAPMRRPRARL